MKSLFLYPWKLPLIFAAVSFLFVSVVLSQEEGEMKKTGEEKTEEDPEKKKKEEEEKKKKTRLEKVKKLKFPRTVASVLNAWAPVPEETDPDEEKKKDENVEENKVEPDPFDETIKELEKFVSLGEWTEVKKIVAEMEEELGEGTYIQMVSSLKSTTLPLIDGLDPAYKKMVERGRLENRPKPTNVFSLDDVVGIISCAPEKVEEDKVVSGLGTILRSSIESGLLIRDFTNAFQQEVKKKALKERLAAKVMKAANQTVEMGDFLPELAKAKTDKDFEGLNLLSDFYQSRFLRDEESDDLENAWEATQSVLAADAVKNKERAAALKQAVNLTQYASDEEGQKWLEGVFKGDEERGKEVLRTLGATVANNVFSHPTSSSTRLRGLELQGNAVEELLRSSPERAKKWSSVLTLLAGNWLKEAELTYRYDKSSSMRSGYQVDRYGNYYYSETASAPPPNRMYPIKVVDLLENVPSEQWQKAIDPTLQPRCNIRIAQLHLKAKQEEEAFPYIEKLAAEFPKEARELCEEFVRVWTKNHDPNGNQSNSRSYYYYSNYDRKAESIPLTRSKQERNLTELAEVVKKLRKLELEDLDEKLLARAFTICHSSAEVYQLEAMERVFGSVDQLEAETLAELIQQMRGNLLGLWRSPAVQKKEKTNRRQLDIQMEVLKGYQMGSEVLKEALSRYPDDWSLHLSRAALRNDENNFRNELAPDSDFTEGRDEALAGFRKAAELYISGAGDRDEDEESNQVFDQWFYASLGASDIAAIKDGMTLRENEAPLIKKALLSLPAKSRERQMSDFANSLFVGAKDIKPAVKHRYLRAGLSIVGDNENAREAKEVFDYYSDLVTEIQLQAKIDGSDKVGNEPFGVFISLRHTRDIERESGGFKKYLQNQNAGGYSYNYGRPTENYREKFEETVREAMKENFDVLAVTFQKEDVNSRAIEPFGWRETPYAYVLLEARGPEIDTVPSVRLDLDFLDTSGYVVLPIESETIPLDCQSSAEARPSGELKVTQILDERQAAEGKLMLEVGARGTGLVPELESLLSFSSSDFELKSTEDGMLSVTEFSEEGTGVVSERRWLLEFQGKEGLEKLPTAFAFGTSDREDVDLSYQRFDDADIADVDTEVISLEQEYGEVDQSKWWWISAALLIGLLLLIFLIRFLSRSSSEEREAVDSTIVPPEEITPFTLLGFLRKVQTNGDLDEKGRKEIAKSIETVERGCFSENESETSLADLALLAKEWGARMNG